MIHPIISLCASVSRWIGVRFCIVTWGVALFSSAWCADNGIIDRTQLTIQDERMVVDGIPYSGLIVERDPARPEFMEIYRVHEGIRAGECITWSDNGERVILSFTQDGHLNGGFADLFRHSGRLHSVANMVEGSPRGFLFGYTGAGDGTKPKRIRYMPDPQTSIPYVLVKATDAQDQEAMKVEP